MAGQCGMGGHKLPPAAILPTAPELAAALGPFPPAPQAPLASPFKCDLGGTPNAFAQDTVATIVMEAVGAAGRSGAAVQLPSAHCRAAMLDGWSPAQTHGSAIGLPTPACPTPLPAACRASRRSRPPP